MWRLCWCYYLKLSKAELECVISAAAWLSQNLYHQLCDAGHLTKLGHKPNPSAKDNDPVIHLLNPPGNVGLLEYFQPKAAPHHRPLLAEFSSRAAIYPLQLSRFLQSICHVSSTIDFWPKCHRHFLVIG